MALETAQLAPEAQILRDYGPAPYHAVYMTGMVLPFGHDATGAPYDPITDAEAAELYAGPFATWAEVQHALRLPLTDAAWKWGPAPFLCRASDLAKLVAAKGQPLVPPTLFD